MLNFIIVPITVFYLQCKHTKLIFSNNQYHDITFLPKKLSNYSSFFSNFSRFTFQFFKCAKSIFVQSPVRGHKYTLDESLLWTHFCVDRTAGPRQFHISSGQNCRTQAALWTLFLRG